MSSGETVFAGPVKILIVEDSKTQAEVLRATLEEYGYIPSVAGNGKEALALLPTINPDIIISDIIMPDMDGYEFCRTVKDDTRYQNIPVILLTMLSDTQDIINAMESGADNFISKPCNAAYIIKRIKRIIAQKNGGCISNEKLPPLEISHAGKIHTISHNRRQIIDFLLSAYEVAMIQREEVITAQRLLASANEEANLYLDIITHDINNVNTGALALTELLTMKVGKNEKRLTQRLNSSINQSIEIIGNVSTIRKLHEKQEAISPVNLDEIIQNEIVRFNNQAIRYIPTDTRVWADSLIGQIFTNLLGNSFKFAGVDAQVAITVQVSGNDVEISVSDNGPGVPDDMKPIIFDRFRKGRNPKSGKGLGLFIVRTLVERYGGKIRVSDRVPGNSSEGTAIYFTLRKVA